jgi:aerobic-type carbon monoxide dehydrogenase small subunit (CoxS/CutS family)
MSRTMDLLVNGVRHSIDAEPDRTLLTVLRDELELTGTKYGCGEGQCGACTVMLEDRALRSCQTKVSVAVGKRITTIEGLEEHGRLHPLQEAFLEHEAMQCGYCTPGMIVSGAALLKRNSNPSEQEIAQAMQGNVCRCGTYPRVVAAMRSASRKIGGRA